MKLAFSESQPDYGHYIFPYAVWAFPEPGETPADFFDRGFLPSSRELDRFYLCRQVRVNLRQYRPSSENRRILRKGKAFPPGSSRGRSSTIRPSGGNSTRPIPTSSSARTPCRMSGWIRCFKGRMTSHLLLFTDAASGAEVGAATLYLEPPAVAYYYYAFYDLNYYSRNLGMFMMTSAVALFAERGFDFLYLGSCYSRNALYKTQFAGAEFFNGVRWSGGPGGTEVLDSARSGGISTCSKARNTGRRFTVGNWGGLPRLVRFGCGSGETGRRGRRVLNRPRATRPAVHSSRARDAPRRRPSVSPSLKSGMIW